MQTFSDIADALRAKEDSEQEVVVSGIWFKRDGGATLSQLKQETPHLFFLAPAEADDIAMRELAYEARHGEPMNAQDRDYLRFLAGQAKK